MKLGARSRVFLVASGVIAAAFAVAYRLVSTSLETRLFAHLRADLEVRLAFLERAASEREAPPDDVAFWDALADELGARGRLRVTLVASGGKVVGDSELDGEALRLAPSQGGRPEVAAALRGGRGETVRHGATVKRRLLYLAAPIRRGGEVVGAVRLSAPLDAIDAAVGGAQRALAAAALLALALAAGLSWGVARGTSRAVRVATGTARRMAEGDLATRTLHSGRGEAGELGAALDRLGENLSATVAELRAERDLLGRILSSMREGVLLLDDEGRTVLVNGALRSMLALGDEVSGRTPLELVRNADLQDLLNDAMRTDAAVSGEIETGGARPRSLLVRAARLEGEPGGGLVAVFVDVTEMRRLETVRRDFVANVSHELRTPVASVRGAAETLRDALRRDPAAAAGFVEIVERNATRLQRLVDDFLELSRVESREFRLEAAPTALAPLAEQALALHREAAAAKRLVVGSTLVPELPPALADGRALGQVLSNLVDNAVKYSPEGASITVGGAAGDGEVHLLVENTGVVIEPRHLGRLFERFYRVDAGRSRDVGGTGLGLAIVKHLVEAMGGRVKVESGAGQKTVFTVSLPRASRER